MKKVLRMPLVLLGGVTTEEINGVREAWMEDNGCDPSGDPYVHFEVKGKSITFRTAQIDGKGPKPSLDDAVDALSTAFSEFGERKRKVALVDGDEHDGVITIQ